VPPSRHRSVEECPSMARVRNILSGELPPDLAEIYERFAAG
jgi:hypothetical protein